MTDHAPIRTAMVLAAGYGKRLRPLTEHMPKPLIPIGRGHLLDWIFTTLVDAGVQRVAVNTHHLAEQIEDHLRERHQGLDVTIFYEPEILGTGGALANARSLLGRDDHFLLVNGDVLCNPDYIRLAAAHTAEAEATLLLTNEPRINTVRIGPNGRVRDVADLLGAVPSVDDRLLTYTGIAVFSKRFLDRLPAGPSELAPALSAALTDDPDAVRGHLLEGGLWHDLGTPARYLEAVASLQEGSERVMRGPGVSVAAGARLRGFVTLYTGCRVDADVELDDCVVMPGVRVRGPAVHHRLVLGDGWVMPAHSPVPVEPPRALRSILTEAGFDGVCRTVPLTGQASDRLFWRVACEGRTAVVMDAHDDALDFDRFVDIAGFLHEQGLGGPWVLAVDRNRPALVMEDLGDASLGRLLADPKAIDPIDDVFARLLDLQTRGTDLVERGACSALTDRNFTEVDLVGEAGYFATRFLSNVCKTDPEVIMSCEAECRSLAKDVAAQPLVLMHRDFQSTNIMLDDGLVRLVDVQGMRLGPRGYDPASLIRDPYLDPTAERVADLRARWAALVSKAVGVDPEVVHHEVVLAGLLRNMQALGAYGFLSHIRGKRSYRRWIMPGLRQLAAGLNDLADLAVAPAMPRLTALVKRILQDHDHLDLDP